MGNYFFCSQINKKTSKLFNTKEIPRVAHPQRLEALSNFIDEFARFGRQAKHVPFSLKRHMCGPPAGRDKT